MKRRISMHAKVAATFAGAATAAALLAVLPAAPASAGVVSSYGTSTSTGLMGPAGGPGSPITAAQILDRAQDWITNDVPYSESGGWTDAAVGGPYRRDCSGFVSMAWGLTKSLVTGSNQGTPLSTVATVLPSDSDLLPGDALVYPNYHAVLFVAWDNKAAGSFYYEAEHTTGEAPSKELYSGSGSFEGYSNFSDFEPMRYNKQLAVPTGTASGPAIFDPASGNLELFVRSGSAMEEKYWNSSGYSAWVNRGGSIASAPAAVYDPMDDAMEVYAAGTNGELEEMYWTASAGWSAWHDLGGSITGTPSALYDPVAGDLEIYATGANGALDEIYWSPSSGWSSWKDQDVFLTGSPSAIDDPTNGHVEVYGTGANGALWEAWWTPATAWTIVSLGGSISGSPSAAYDPASSNDYGDGYVEVYANSPGGNLEEDYYGASSGWSGWKVITSGAGNLGSPSAAYNPGAGTFEVYVTTSNDTVYQSSWSSSGGWKEFTLPGSVSPSYSPAVMYDAADGKQEVYAVSSASELMQDAWSQSTGWVSSDLAGSLSGS